VAIFRIALAMIRSHEPQLRELQNSADIFNALSDLPRTIHEVDELLDVAYSLAGSFSDVTLDSYRRRHLAYLMSDRGTLVGNPESAANLPKQHLSRYFFCLYNHRLKCTNSFSYNVLGEKLRHHAHYFKCYYLVTKRIKMICDPKTFAKLV
jgi:hypothetical protein